MFDKLNVAERQILINQLCIMNALKDLSTEENNKVALNGNIRLTFEMLGGNKFDIKSYYKEILGGVE